MNFYRSCIASSRDFAPSYSALVNNNITKTSFENEYVGDTVFNSAVNVGNNVINCINAFRGCTGFNQPVTIASGSDEIKCQNMFRGCTRFNSLVSIHRPVNYADNMFAGCTALSKGTTISGGAIEASNMYAGAGPVGGVSISGSSVNISNIFAGAGAISSAAIIGSSGVNASNAFARTGAMSGASIISSGVVNATKAFAGSGVVRGVTIAGSSVNPTNLFDGCTSLAENVNLQNIPSANDLFRGCSNLKGNLNIKIYDNNPSNIFANKLNNIFYGCTALNHDIIIAGNYINKGDNMFANHPNINCNVYLQNINSCNYMFWNCRNLRKNIRIDYDNTSKSAPYMFAHCTNLVSDIDCGIIDNGLGMFEGCTNLSHNISIHPNTHGSGVNWENMFKDCKNLTRIDLPNFERFGSATRTFENCSKLNQSFNISLGAYTFSNCVSLNAPITCTSIDKYAFRGCTNFNSPITMLFYPSYNVIYDAESAFENCTKFNQIITNLNEYTVYNANRVFYGCSALNQLINIKTFYGANEIFKGCSSLKQVIFNPFSYAYDAFDGCTNLTDVTLLRRQYYYYDFLSRLFPNKNKALRLNLHLNKFAVPDIKNVISRIVIGDNSIQWTNIGDTINVYNALWNIYVYQHE